MSKLTEKFPFDQTPQAPEKSPQSDVVPERAPTAQNDDPQAGLQTINESENESANSTQAYRPRAKNARDENRRDDQEEDSGRFSGDVLIPPLVP